MKIANLGFAIFSGENQPNFSLIYIYDYGTLNGDVQKGRIQ